MTRCDLVSGPPLGRHYSALTRAASAPELVTQVTADTGHYYNETQLTIHLCGAVSQSTSSAVHPVQTWSARHMLAADTDTEQHKRDGRLPRAAALLGFEYDVDLT